MLQSLTIFQNGDAIEGLLVTYAPHHDLIGWQQETHLYGLNLSTQTSTITFDSEIVQLGICSHYSVITSSGSSGTTEDNTDAGGFDDTSGFEFGGSSWDTFGDSGSGFDTSGSDFGTSGGSFTSGSGSTDTTSGSGSFFGGGFSGGGTTSGGGDSNTNCFAFGSTCNDNSNTFGGTDFGGTTTDTTNNGGSPVLEIGQ